MVKVMVMIVITFLFFFVELVVGFMNRSIALLADSYHMLSDVMALVIAFVCLRISRHKSKRNGFGWVRAEVLGALVNGVFLLAMCFTISLESIGRMIHPRSISHPLQVLAVGCVGLLINMIGIGMFHSGHGHSHGSGGHSHNVKKKSKSSLTVKRQDANRSKLVSGFLWKIWFRKGNSRVPDAQNLNMRGVFLHILSDAIGSLFVIVTASVALFFPAALGPFKTLKTAGIILRRTPPFIDLEYIKTDIMKPMIETFPPKIRKIFHKHGIHSLTMQPLFSSVCSLFCILYGG
ncbi:unnamed protein product [Angiostrongylus costaricensis]|uniref:Zinc transporter n=1 Tax=Angiostrongylus costaricensis TaxID=334426 RepID=A0A0R3PT51_ANGCS|nr:unnamed protein product [Angiostrongylus costaricensis]